MVLKVVREDITAELNWSFRVVNRYGFPTAILDQAVNTKDLVADIDTHGMLVDENHIQDKESIKATFPSCNTLSIKSCGDRSTDGVSNPEALAMLVEFGKEPEHCQG